MDISHFVYPFISWWTFGLILLYGFYEYYYNEHYVQNHQFSKVVAAFYNTINNVWRFQFFFIIIIVCIFLVILVKWHLVLICISLMAWFWTSFHVFIGYLHIFLEKYPFISLAHFKIGLFVFLLLTYKCFYIFRIQVLYHIYYLQTWSPILWVIFLLSWCILWSTVVFNFD